MTACDHIWRPFTEIALSGYGGTRIRIAGDDPMYPIAVCEGVIIRTARICRRCRAVLPDSVGEEDAA